MWVKVLKEINDLDDYLKSMIPEIAIVIPYALQIELFKSSFSFITIKLLMFVGNITVNLHETKLVF